MRMKAGCSAARRFQTFCQPLNAVGIFGVNHGHCTVLAGDIQHVENLPVVELHVVVRHVNFERREALPNQLRQLFLQHLGRRVADDQMKRVVHMGLALGACPVVFNSGLQ